ncbi:putative permease [Desulfocurvibacter africanus PCS]|uniref:Probable membrane transporter protein n=1 Tax=Desulfocurvibacter africanus PCS TaxID=1262666 RepID=M5PRD8_DESAF|nr:sulfite exporter TauE/SafE family protein [Desulfocurvibacter africanus]EMG36699.1 putative permease [Desulfocurvibacter africanus PCS]
MDTLTLVAITAAAGFAGFTQGFAGFGSTLVALPLLGMVLDVRTAVPVCCLMALVVNVVLVARLHRHVQRGPLGWLIVASLPGMAVGTWMLGIAPEGLLKGLLGASVLLTVVHSLRSDQPKVPSRKEWVALAGLLAGCLGVCIGINGPPIVAWAARQPWSRSALKATLTSYFLLAGIGIVGVQTANGLVTRHVLLLFVVAIPALAAGLWAGGAYCGRMSDTAFRRCVLALLAITGATLLWQVMAAA